MCFQTQCFLNALCRRSSSQVPRNEGDAHVQYRCSQAQFNRPIGIVQIDPLQVVRRITYGKSVMYVNTYNKWLCKCGSPDTGKVKVRVKSTYLCNYTVNINQKVHKRKPSNTSNIIADVRQSEVEKLYRQSNHKVNADLVTSDVNSCESEVKSKQI